MSIIKNDIIVYKGRNSPVTIDLALNGVDYNLSTESVTKVAVVIGGVEYSSDDGYIEYVGASVTFKLGTVPNPPARKLVARLVIYSATYPLGRPIISEKTDYRLAFEFV
mgnify:CR=1 FL=1